MPWPPGASPRTCAISRSGATPRYSSQACYKGLPLPEKPIVITLDDGRLNNLTYVLPILEESDAKAVISVLGSFTERFSGVPYPNLNYGHLSWEDIKTLHEFNRVEIGNHSYFFHSGQRIGSMRRRNETREAYEERFRDDIGGLQEELKRHTGIVPTTFAYPFGSIGPEVLPILKKLGFQTVHNCNERLNHITRDPERLFHLNRINRPGGPTTAAFMEKTGLD